MSASLARRDFLAATAAATAGAALAAPRAFSAENTPSRKVVVGVMGLGGRGTGLACDFQRQPGVEVAYVCDVDRRRAAVGARAVAEVSGRQPKAVGDFRRILDDRSVDLLVIATADHWHAPAALLACAAGKHVYVEKPCCHNPQEGELLLAAARKHKRLVQHGTQRRSWPAEREAIERLRGGVIGRVLFARAAHTGIRSPIGRGKPVPVPDWLDWDLWQGPAPRRPYRDNLVHYNWHFFWHYSGGEIVNNGVHKIDVARWGLAVEFPRQVNSTGAKLCFQDDGDTPDTHVVSYDFGDKMLLFENRNWHRGLGEYDDSDVTFFGDQGTLAMGGSGYKVYDMAGKLVGQGTGRSGDADHIQNLLGAIRDERPLNADIEIACTSTLLCHLGTIAHRTGRSLKCDPTSGRILDDPEAQKLWGREYEPSWEPKL
jgi:predicted dehydrogenase